MFLFANFNPNRLRFAACHNETALKELTRLDLLKKDLWIWKQVHLHRAYSYLHSDEFKESMNRIKTFFKKQKEELAEGLVKYNNFVFWWKIDEDKYGANFRRYWRFRKAK